MLTAVITHATGDVFPASDWNTDVRDNINFSAVQGADVASVATISPAAYYQRLTGTTTVQNITAPTLGTNPEIELFVRDGLTIQHNAGGTGNIRLLGAQDAILTAGVVIAFVYDAAQGAWQEARRSGAGIGATVATTVAGLGAGTAGKVGWIRLMPSTYNAGGSLALPAATITVGDTTEFATSGTLTTPNGVITYTGKTATTFTGCTGGVGTLAANAPITQASGTLPNPYETIGLTYDAVLGKWVSAAQSLAYMGSNATGGPGTTSLTFAELFANGLSGPAIPWRAYDAAGLKPQLRLCGTVFNNTGGTTVTMCPSFDGANYGSAANAPRNHNGGDASAASPATAITGTSTDSMFSTEWGNIPGGYTLYDFFQPGAQQKVSGGAGAMESWTWFLRWVG